uniref:Actin-like protein 7B n=1 Tax=Microcebus murinus TaxID=30608 RepID=A0A8C5XYH7_MICMU
MEATKKVGGPDPSGPQGHPSASSQKLGGGLRGPQGPWISSESLYLKQGLSLSTKNINDGTCGPASQAHVSEPIHQLLQDPTQVSSQCCCEQPSQDAPRLFSTSLFQSPVVGAQQHLIMEDVTLTLPVCTHSDTSDIAQYGPYRPRLQVQIEGEGKAPAKVLVGWGKGPCSPDQMAPLGTRKSRWLPYFLSGEDGAAEAQGLHLAPAQDLAQEQGQGKCLCPAQAPALATTSFLSLTHPTPAQANTPALDATSKSTAVETYTCTHDHLTNTTAVTNRSQDLLLRRCDNQWSILLESSKMVTSCQDKENFHSKEEPPTPVPTPEEFPDRAQEHEVARKQVPPKQAENPAGKPLVCISRPGSPPGPEAPDTTKSQKSSQICGSQLEKQPPNVCDSTCSNMPPSAYQVTRHKESPFPSPREAMQIPSSSAPTCQLREAVEDRVLVFDMATGNTRMGLLCHDPMGSRAVLVGLMPNHPSIYVPENMQSPQLLTKPIPSPDSNNSSLWSTTPMVSSPVPSSVSSGSYREVALVPKEARLHLETRDSPGTETPIKVGMLSGPVPLGMPLQHGERIMTHVPSPGWSKPDAGKNESSHTIWMLDSSRMPDASMVQTKKLQWMEPAGLASTQEVPKSLLQEDAGSHNRKEVITSHPDNPQAKDAEQAPLTGQILLAGLYPLNEQYPLTDQPPLTGQTPLAKQLSLTRKIPLTGKPCFSKEPPITKEPTLSRGPPTTGEPGQASTLECEPSGLPTHVGVLQVPLTPEETYIYMNRDKVGIGNAQSSSMHQLTSWQPGSSPRAQEEQLSLITFATPGTGGKALPMAMVGTEPQSAQFKLTAEDITHPSVVAHLGLLHGACYELVSTVDALPVRSPVLCHHSLRPYKDMAAVVIDTGTGFTKCGLAGEDHVLSVVPSRVQLLQHPAQGQPRYAVPENLEGSYSVLNRGVVSDWDALEVLWQHLFYCRLGVQPEELAVLVADSPISPRTNREKVAEILFERFHVPAMQTVHQALLALYAYGRTTGLVLGSGHGTSYVAPILTGDLAPLDTYRLDVAGADLTEYLTRLLQVSGQSLPKAGLVNQIKEACCYVAMDTEAEIARTQAQARVDFVLPDKQVITLGSERFCCPEALFKPNLLGINQPGLPQLALLSISRLEAKQQEQLLANVVLDGGSTLLSGFPERLRQELGPGATVLGSPHRAVAAWLGGSIMASRDSFQSLWLSRREYEEEGPWAIYKYQL